MDIINILQRAYALIERPEHWLRHSAIHIDASGSPTAFCASGALWWVGHQPSVELIVMAKAMAALTYLLPLRDVISYNDEHSHSQILRLFRLAIANERAGGRAARAQARRIRQLIIALRKSHINDPLMDEHENGILPAPELRQVPLRTLAGA